jgi:branched-chain amino acid transport system substrate-binding protein
MAPLVVVGLGAVASGCLLTNVSYTPCTADAECASAFGAGSTCQAGFCGASPGCTTGHDCRKQLGGGACVMGSCVSTIPVNASCQSLVEPPGLLSQPLLGTGAPLVIGGIFALQADHDVALTKAIRMAVQEINQNGALNNGQSLGIVFCDNGGPGGMASDAERATLDAQDIDYLAGTLGVPYIVGPLTSKDALDLINEIKAKLLPTLIISPSATSPTLTTVDDKLHPSDPVGLFWRTCPSDVLQASVLADHVINQSPSTHTVTVIFDKDAYGSGLQMAFAQDWAGATQFVPYNDPLDAPGTPGSTNTAAAVAQAAEAAGGDAVLLVALSGATALSILQAMDDSPLTQKPFFFTDGSKDLDLLKDQTPWIKTLLLNAHGTAAATGNGTDYNSFAADLNMEFQIAGSAYSFLAQAYDATYVGALGTVYASRSGHDYDGIDVGVGMTHLNAGVTADLGGASGWSAAKGPLTAMGSVHIIGASGALAFDPKTGDVPGGVAVWTVKPDFSGYVDGAVY